MVPKTKQWIALATIALATMALAACSGSGSGGAPAANCGNPQIAGTPACMNTRGVGRIGTGTYIPGFPAWGKVQLMINSPMLMTALCQQSIDTGGTINSDAALSLNSSGNMFAAPSSALCTSLGPTILTFHIDTDSNVIKWRFYYNQQIPSPIYQGMVQRMPNGSFQAQSGGMVFIGSSAGTALTVTLTAPNAGPNGVIATGSMVPSVQ